MKRLINSVAFFAVLGLFVSCSTDNVEATTSNTKATEMTARLATATKITLPVGNYSGKNLDMSITKDAKGNQTVIFTAKIKGCMSGNVTTFKVKNIASMAGNGVTEDAYSEVYLVDFDATPQPVTCAYDVISKYSRGGTFQKPTESLKLISKGKTINLRNFRAAKVAGLKDLVFTRK
ncbi:hypothetical protein [Flavobacterium sp.]|uniref:hypothetical protein n=1 Tax=Flavobacterium sp. TaxID=239 RepID=UPI003D0E4BB1